MSGKRAEADERRTHAPPFDLKWFISCGHSPEQLTVSAGRPLLFDSASQLLDLLNL